MGKKDKLNTIVTNLLSTDDTIVVGALKDLRQHGNATAVPALVQVLVNNPSPQIEKEVIKLLNELKDTKAIPYLFDAVDNESTKGHKHILVGAFWQAGLNVETYLPQLVKIAIEEDYLTCLECLTVIGEFEGKFKDDEVMMLASKVMAASAEQPEKEDLLKELAKVLKQLVVS